MKPLLRAAALKIAQWFADRADGDGHVYVVTCAACLKKVQRAQESAAFQAGRGAALHPHRPAAVVGEA